MTYVGDVAQAKDGRPLSVQAPRPTPVKPSKYTVEKAMRLLRSIPADVAFRLTNTGLVSDYLERRYEAMLHNGNPPLSEIEAVAVAGLRRDGVYVTDLKALGLANTGQHDIITRGSQVAEILAARGASMGSTCPAVMASKPSDLLNNPEVYRWGLNPTILRIVEAYQKLPVAYDGPLVFHAQADGQETASRLWHLDREDRRVIKVALYLHDVTDEGGPFQVLNWEARAPGAPFRYRALNTAALRKEFGDAVISQNTMTCPGKAGTVIFAETGRFYHRGKPATFRERSTIFYSYFSRKPRHPFYCSRSRLTRAEIVHLVAGLNPEQQACALWQDELPLIARMIPPSQM